MLLNIHTCSGKGLRPHYMQLSAGDIIGGIHSYDLDDKSTKSTILFVRIYFYETLLWHARLHGRLHV